MCKNYRTLDTQFIIYEMIEEFLEWLINKWYDLILIYYNVGNTYSPHWNTYFDIKTLKFSSKISILIFESTYPWTYHSVTIVS